MTWRTKRVQILARDKWTCVYCGEPATQVDHIVPRYWDGTDHQDNLVAACQPCNQIATAHLFHSFRDKKAWIRGMRGITTQPPVLVRIFRALIGKEHTP